MADSLQHLISALEDETWKVLTTGGEGLLKYLSPDCIMLFPFGMKISALTTPSIKDVMTSDAFLPWKSYNMSDVAVTPLGEDSAVISYKVRALRPDPKGKDNKFHALIGSVWRKDPATQAWLMCFHQQTPFDHTIEDMA